MNLKGPHLLTGIWSANAALAAKKNIQPINTALTQDEGKAYSFPMQLVIENQAYAVQSTRQEDTEKTADPRVKYLRTLDGKEIKPDREEILITTKDGVTLVTQK